jgi:hypothetical protein
VIDPTTPGDRPRHAADSALDLVRGRTARPVTRVVQAAAIRRRIRIPLRFADGLLSINPDEGAQLAHLGITIASQVPTALHLAGSNAAYLATKARRGGHDLLSGSLEHAAESRRDACPLPGPPGPGFEAR